MNKNHKYFLQAIAFVVLLGLQLSAYAQAPAPGKAPQKKQVQAVEQKTEKKAEPGSGQPQRFSLQSIPIAGDTTHSLNRQFLPATAVKKAPDAKGFIQRWLVLEPVKKNLRSNSSITESYLRTTFASENFSQDLNIVPQNSQVNNIGGQDLKWYALDSKSFNFNLYQFSYATNKTRAGVLFWLVTVIDCPQEIKNVRLAVGVNSAGAFWLNGQEILLAPGDKDIIVDNIASPLVTLKKGRNVLRAAVLNGQGMVNFCARFVDEKGAPVKNYTLSVQ